MGAVCAITIMKALSLTPCQATIRETQSFLIRYERDALGWVSILDPATIDAFSRHAISSSDYRALRSEAMIAWREIAESNSAA